MLGLFLNGGFQVSYLPNKMFNNAVFKFIPGKSTMLLLCLYFLYQYNIS